MREVKIKFDFSHGPIWKDQYNIDTGEWLTGISVIDNDKELSVLNEKAEKEYSTLYSFKSDGMVNFNVSEYEKKKEILLSMVQAIIQRLNYLNDGSFRINDEETPKLIK